MHGGTLLRLVSGLVVPVGVALFSRVLAKERLHERMQASGTERKDYRRCDYRRCDAPCSDGYR